ncbi:LysM peptidoglycan-binding domain-containing protein [Roseimicrobium sp. ORNL1]|uniref:LysM peptidoglycan-binding domain-containing protein n=1 Tax=Roseimicrobium sp. ORNL1 TaxID=2711231 RepID=UPI0013E1E04E|nr:LysM peptidoglycan-binding domain-containing protein [Roseimicrobium sp. ORNL1]QIF02611.1 LysM peptidoglycan-binding domain-containing protein [Roseimicrobium sp. ORNL1]
MSRFKIVIFLMAVGIAGSIIATAYWYYTRVLGHDTKLQGEIKQLQAQKTTLPDPGVKRFDKAVELLNENNFGEARVALVEMLKTFPDSSRAGEARRIIGEMNMDMLFSKEDNTARRDYIVQPGQGLQAIATKNQTTIECLLRANGLQSHMLQPGDKISVFPLDFEILIDASDKTLQLKLKGLPFKMYNAIDIKVPPGMKIPQNELKIASKSAIYNGKQVNALSPDFMEADKWLTATRGNNNFMIRSMPRAKAMQPAAAPVPAPAVPEAHAGKDKGGKGKQQQQSGKKGAQPTAEEATVPEPAPTGIFLPREDIEELYTIIRQQTPVVIIR